MEYLSFSIKNYRAIEDEVEIDLSKNSLIPLVGINECGKTTILQAIYCFDSVNDDEYKGRHLKDTNNLYQTIENADPIVSAKLKVKTIRFKEIFEETIDEYNSHKLKEYNKKVAELKEQNKPNTIPFPRKLKKEIVLPKDSHITCKISRNLKNKKYSIELNTTPPEINNLLAENICGYAPYILYNDDFMDRVPNSIFIPNGSSFFSGWSAIFERVFKAAHEKYSLANVIKETDSRRKDGIISDVENILNNTLTKTWKTFSLGSNSDITIKLKLVPGEEGGKKGYHLEIKIVDKTESRERYFDIVDRSKGFLWFFNFVMKLEFNPKRISEGKTIYLLDEPGSYLHYSAQENLCIKLVDISKKHGKVIFCTHSHTLLNPEHIPINSIYIVEKTKQRKIIAMPIAKVVGKTEKNNAFQPIHDALQMSSFTGVTNQSVIVVEGIYDKYAMQLMLDTNNYAILPSTSANAIIKNIQYLNGFHKHYIAVWDNDGEGQKAHKEALKFFGEIEGRKFDLLPLMKRNSRKMEQMFEEEDMLMMKNHLKLDDSSTYEKVIMTLFYSDRKTQELVVGKISSETKRRFEILKGIIEKRFAESKKIMNT